MIYLYFLGEVRGQDVKVGHTKRGTLRGRLKEVNSAQMTGDRYVPLAAVAALGADETFIKRHFKEHLRPKGERTEYFWPRDPVVHYVNWLRSQYWACIDPDEDLGSLPILPSDLWLPNGPSREIAPPPIDTSKIVQDYEDPSDVLYNTSWSWMAGQKAGVQSFFTPVEIVNAAREAMGEIDLDAASEPLANRTHRIRDYFHTGRSAFHNDWYGRVWLNPPYGNNAPWFERIEHFVHSGAVSQLCMISPMWAFQTQIAKPVMEMSSGLILLSPTPKFWGNADPNRTGVNHPHGILYLGPRTREFYRAFSDFGFPVRFAWKEAA